MAVGRLFEAQGYTGRRGRYAFTFGGTGRGYKWALRRFRLFPAKTPDLVVFRGRAARPRLAPVPWWMQPPSIHLGRQQALLQQAQQEQGRKSLVRTMGFLVG